MVLCVLISNAIADEGMWTFDNPPLQQLREKYHFEPTAKWLDHLRLSSVRLEDGGSGSFVSGHGLLLTNHHVALQQLQNASNASHDYVRDGFYAATTDAEMKTPDLEVNVLVSMENVTDKVNAAVQPGMSETAAFDARRSVIAGIENQSKQQTHLRSNVVTLYDGGQYWLYCYKRYTDVRLVFAPELQTAFFGGDSDNFTFPRYCLDMAVYRVYEDGKPLETPNHLSWNTHDLAENELVFVSGHPGSTDRSKTMAELIHERDFSDPVSIEGLENMVATDQAFAARGTEQAREVASENYFLQNSEKSAVGKYHGLLDAELMAKKQAEEDDFRRKIDASPACKAEVGHAWQEIEQTVAAIRAHGKERYYRYLRSQLAAEAGAIVKYVAEIKKPDGDRLPYYHEAQLESLRFQLLSPAPIYPDLELARTISGLELSSRKLHADDPWLSIVLDGKSPEAAATQYLSQTKIGDPAFRKQLMDGGVDAVNASTDPLIVLARKLDPMDRAEQRFIETHLTSQSDHAHQQLAKARFAIYGTSTYPNATFTLRLSYGTVRGFPMNGTVSPWKTNLLGLYARNSEFDNAAPWNLTERWKNAQTKLDLATPFDFVADTDITGGNSGSPVVNKNGELVGLVFDGNIDSLAGKFEFDPKHNRTVAVHSAAMIEALRKLYGAEKLADEMQKAG
jgi:hypothetical protein